MKQLLISLLTIITLQTQATTLGKTMWMKFEYDTVAGKWDLITLRDGF